MSVFDKLFGGSPTTEVEIKNACDSDIFDNIAKVINGDKVKYDKVVSYLGEQGNLSMQLRVLTMSG